MIAKDISDRQKKEAETWKWSEETGLPPEEAERLNAERYAKFTEDGKEIASIEAEVPTHAF